MLLYLKMSDQIFYPPPKLKLILLLLYFQVWITTVIAWMTLIPQGTGLKSQEEHLSLTLMEMEKRSLTQGQLRVCRMVPITSLLLS